MNEFGDVKLSNGVVLKNFLYASDFKNNVLSISKLLQNKIMQFFFIRPFHIIAHGKNEYDLYRLVNEGVEHEKSR